MTDENTEIINKLSDIIKNLELEMNIQMQGKRFLVEIKGDHPQNAIFFKEYEIGETLLDALKKTYWGLLNFSSISERINDK